MTSHVRKKKRQRKKKHPGKASQICNSTYPFLFIQCKYLNKGEKNTIIYFKDENKKIIQLKTLIFVLIFFYI